MRPETGQHQISEQAIADERHKREYRRAPQPAAFRGLQSWIVVLIGHF
jgi:hypothetical protein